MTSREPSLSIVPATELPRAEFAALFARAYSDYLVPFHVDEAAITTMIRHWDLSLADSRVVRRAGEPVAFACLAVRGTRGWISGMGVPPEHRGHGLGEVAMRAVLDSARALGLHAVDLEVLTGNTIARTLYERIGFTHVRSLEIWTADPTAAPAGSTDVDGFMITPCTVVEALAAAPGHAPHPPWQRMAASIANIQAHGTALVAFAANREGLREGPAEAIVVAARVPGRASILALDAPPRLAPALLAVASEGAALRMINVPEDDPVRAALLARGGRVDLKQFEMTWTP